MGSGLDLIPLINQHKPLIPIIIFSAQHVDKEIENQVNAALIKSKITNDELVGIIKNLISSTGKTHDKS